MEDSTENKETNKDQHPKPNEEIQLEIETVTPDTEKEGLPNDQKHNKRLEDEVEQKSEESTEEVAENESDEDQHGEDTAKAELEEEGAPSEDKKDDAAPDIETVSP